VPGEKGSYRSVYSAIWDDPEFQELGYVAQLVFFCLRTSKDCTFPCIFTMYASNLYDRIPGLEPTVIDKGVETLVERGWVKWQRPVWWIIKGLKNEPNYYPNNSKHVIGIANILKSLPKLKIVEEFATFYNIPYLTDTGINEGIHTRIHTRIEGVSKQGTGTGTGKGKGKDQRLTPAKPVDNSTGTSGGDRAPTGPSPPVPPSGEIDPEVKNLEEIIKRRRQEMGIE